MKNHRSAIIILTTLVAGCASVPPRPPAVHTQALLRLVRSGASDDQLKAYFDEYAERLGCYTADGCHHEKEITVAVPDYNGGQRETDLSYARFVETLRASEDSFKAGLAHCAGNVSCLGGLIVLTSAGGSKAPICPTARPGRHHARHGSAQDDDEEGSTACAIEEAPNSTLFVKNAETAGRDGWIEDSLRAQFLAIFRDAAANSNATAESAIHQSEEEKKQQQEAERKKWQLMGKKITQAPYWLRSFDKLDTPFAKRSRRLLSKIASYDEIKGAPFCVATFVASTRSAVLHCAQNATRNGYEAQCSLFEVNLGSDYGGYARNGSIPGKCDQKKVGVLIRSSQLEFIFEALGDAEVLRRFGDVGIYIYRDGFKSIKQWLGINETGP